MVFTRRPLTTTSRRLTAGCAEPEPDCAAAASRGSCAAISSQLVKTIAGSTARGLVALCVFITFSSVGWLHYSCAKAGFHILPSFAKTKSSNVYIASRWQTGGWLLFLRGQEK